MSWAYRRARLREALVLRACRKKGHKDVKCYSVIGSTGVCCNRCGRILWEPWSWQRGDGQILQDPTFPTLYSNFGTRPWRRKQWR